MLIPGDISKGSRAYVGMTWTNVWSNDSEFLLDYEMLDTLVGFGYGFNNNFGVGAFLDNRSYFGGLMDDFIEGFHNMFGIDQDGRDKAPSGRSVIQLKDPETGEVTAEIPADKLDNTGLSILANYNFYFENPQLPSMNPPHPPITQGFRKDSQPGLWPRPGPVQALVRTLVHPCRGRLYLVCG